MVLAMPQRRRYNQLGEISESFFVLSKLHSSTTFTTVPMPSSAAENAAGPGQQLCHVKGAAAAVASTVAGTAKPVLATGLVFVKGVASKTEGVGVGKAAVLVGGAAAATASLG
ncbi:hypothetical protein GUJ93_ZPchr0007g5411 [Zizania palustris]|uniref:Uncharacterized protein n=1 Tax=Zizania palustris TaxID=103762 RepID=A0A8J5W683_ZIZPA|nr:hypothetical protein GUJ93_ZPchr0007g5411 [Zizania palustris]